MRTFPSFILRCCFLVCALPATRANLFWKEGNSKLFGDTVDPNGDQFGQSVAIYNDLLVVGASEDTPNGDGSGAAYVFRRGSDPKSWTKVATLVADDGRVGDNFGWSVAIQGPVIAVGAQKRTEDSPGEREQGAVYIFDTETFTQQQKLLAGATNGTDGLGGQGDFFGFSIALDLPTLVVGSPFNDNGIVESGGSVYTFNYDGTNFTQTQYIVTTEDTAERDFFGYSVAISSNTLVTTAIGDDGIGSAYIYTTNDFVTWTQQQRITTRKGKKGDEVGRAVAIDGDVLVMGAANVRELPPRVQKIWDRITDFLPDRIADFVTGRFGVNLGVAYVFVRSGGSWEEKDRLSGNVGFFNRAFGRSVAINQNRIVVGVPNAFRLRGTRKQAGAIIVYRPWGNRKHKWRQQCRISPSDVQDEDDFGHAVALSDGTIVVGSRQEDENGFTSGAVYTYFNERLAS